MNKASNITFGIDFEAAVRGIEAHAKLRERRSGAEGSNPRAVPAPGPAENRIDDETRHQRDKGRLIDIVA